MKAVLIPVDGYPHEIDLKVEENGSVLPSLQSAVGGLIDAFDPVFNCEPTLYVNDEGIYSCPPNRAIYATEQMAEIGYVSQLSDGYHPIQKDELYTVIFGDIVAIGLDRETGESRDITAEEARRVISYFSEISAPGSGLEAVIAIKTGIGLDEVMHRNSDTVELANEARDMREAVSGPDEGFPDRCVTERDNEGGR